MPNTCVVGEFLHFYYLKWRHLVNLLLLKLKRNGLLTLVLTCGALSDLNPVYYAV